MIDQRTRDAIEFDDLLGRIAGRAMSSLGADEVLRLEPATEQAEIARRQARVTEVLRLFEANKRLPLSGTADVSAILESARLEGTALQPEDWQPLRAHLDAVGQLCEFGERNAEGAPEMARMCGALVPNGPLQLAISRVFDEDGLIRDNASPELADVRGRMRRAEREAMRTIARIVADLKTRGGVLQEDFSTQRNGRHVLPVRAGSRGRIQGIVHGSSASGGTLYVEPAEVVEASNELELLREREAREIHRIMRELTAMLRPYIPAGLGNLEAIARIDCVQALARNAWEHGWHFPAGGAADAVRLSFAHHPMLHIVRPESSVPIAIALDRTDRTIVLSGPNAGGKTTAMKTLALAAILTQCGSPIPASPDSRLPVFNGFHADIGDSQNLSEGVSTFSGHIRRLREILDAADDQSLVLLDELGTGTDPEEGGALARALLEELKRRARLTVATTHLGPVITWAEDETGARNASFSLDEATHRPTFNLRLDLPGASEAITMAENEGMPAWVLERARSLVGEQKLAMGELLRRIEERDRTLAERLREANDRAESLDRQEALARKHAEELRRERRELRKSAAEEREAAVRETRERLERMIAELPGEAELEQRKRALNDMRRVATAEQQKLAGELRTLRDTQEDAPKTLEPGAKVYVPVFGSWGQVRRVSGDGRKATVIVGAVEAEVAVGSLSRTEPEASPVAAHTTDEDAPAKSRRSRKVKEALRHAPAEPSRIARKAKRAPAAASGADAVWQPPDALPMELDLHGYYVEEALAELDRYLDRALMADYPYVRIMHGTGQGKLYRAVHEFLRTYKPVSKYRFGTPDEGGGGVTIAEF